MLNYPLTLSFKIIAIAPQIKLTDARGQTRLYVRQKALALREDVKIFEDESQERQLYQLNADRMLDWSANYRIRTTDGRDIGTVRRQGMRSLWKATYEVTNSEGGVVAAIREESAWVKVLDGLVGGIPYVGWVAAMFINPAYLVERNGETLLRVQKERAFFEGRFTIQNCGDLSDDEETLLITSILMMVLLERQRG